METLPVQPADAVATVLPASTPSTGVPTGDGTFAMTLGRALESLPASNQDEESTASQASPTSPRAKAAATYSGDAYLMAGAIFNFFIANPSQPPTPVVADVDTAVPAAALPIPSDTPAGGSSPRLNLMGNPTADRNGSAPIDPQATGGAGAPIPNVFGAGKSSGLWGMPRAAATGDVRRGRSPKANQTDSSTSPAGTNVPPSITTDQPATWIPALQSVPVPVPLTLPTPTAIPSAPEPVAAADPSAAPSLGTPQKSQVPANSQPSWENLGATSLPPAVGGIGFREISNLPQEPPVAAGLPAPISAPPPGEERQASAAPEVEAATSTPSFDADDRIGLSAFSSLPEMPVVTPGQAAPPAGQTSLSVPAPGPQVGDAFTSLRGTDRHEPTGHASVGEKSEGTNRQAAASFAPAPAMAAGSAVSPPDANDDSAAAEVLTLLGTVAGPDATLQVSGSEPPEPTGRSATETSPVSPDAPDGRHKVTADAVQTSAPSKFQFAPNDLTRDPSLSTQGSVAPNAAGEKDHRGETFNAQAVPLTAPSPVPFAPHESSRMDAPAKTSPATETGGSRPGTPAISTSGTGGAHTNLADSSLGGQGKSAPQNGGAPGSSPASAPSPTHNVPADPAVNILTAHPPATPPSHDETASLRMPPAPAHTPTTLTAWQNYEGGAGSIVRSASLGDSGHGTEMHVELRSGTLGPLEVHAVMHEGSVGAEIRVQGQEAHTLLAAGLPSLERALGERNLRVENLTVYQDQTGGGMSGGEKHGSQSGSSPSPQHPPLPWDSPAQRGSSHVPVNEELTDPESGLSVRA